MTESGTDATGPQGRTVAIIASDHFEEAELVTPRDELAAQGATVLVYSQSGQEIQAVEGDTEKTRKIAVDGAFGDVDVATIDALVVPGGTVNADTIRTDATAQQLVTSALEAGKPTAVICHGPWLLVSAGLVEGRRLTSFPSLADDVRNAGGDWVDEEVVVDGDLITSRNPGDLPAFVGAIASALSAGRG
ncbi:type 1 glutamine amidotransferase [Nocardioides sp. ChNu-153]|uniref:type 1 glutamine amidotransferase domain-containing protein n=1 Tax=unclassified Nocardioides TaxID=2615069 RepID=UPI0024057B2C|nr:MULTISPECIES: type 1 glutamine amidotransferase domain-containing protein [unclassified Nocardioides]MDF9715988.1 type 1 glutamine amidotransferase [Nocardioides sp. ChNu-99]MDN7119956.1 type 1 glutamine amidotransferase [Nocardioides sp. ChNu-153]